jgi:hypothetical protein
MAQPDEGPRADENDTPDILRPATEDLEAPLPDAFEQTLPAQPEDQPEEPPRVRPDVSEADAIEQALLAVPDDRPERPRIPPDVSEADAIEQAQTVELHDDYE